jgi:signal transduction histidine kinase
MKSVRAASVPSGRWTRAKLHRLELAAGARVAALPRLPVPRDNRYRRERCARAERTESPLARSLQRWRSRLFPTMPVSIRSRLLLLVLAWALPALAALLAVAHFTAGSAQQANERALRDVARAMAMVVDREIDRRAFVARALAGSRPSSALQQPGDQDVAAFRTQARAAMEGLDGWVEVRDARGVVLDSRDERASPDTAPAASTNTTPRLIRTAGIGPLEFDAGRPPYAVVIHPVINDGALVANVVVAILPSELQRVLDAQGLPQGWVGAVLDTRRRIVARQPGGASMIGREATPDVRERLAQGTEGGFEGTSIDGNAVTGYFSTSPHGWTYVAAMPRVQFGGYLDGATPQITLGALALLTLAILGALWVSRGVARAVVSLETMASELETGRPVMRRGTGIRECDDVAAALEAASIATRGARAELEQQVAQAVARTRDAEQQAARSLRVAALGRLTGGVAHDVNNLLGVVSNSAHLIQRHADATPQLQSPVAAILRAVDAGSRLTQQLMRFAARRPLEPRTLDIARAMPELHELIGNVVGKRIDVQTHVQPGTASIVVDAAELELALVNLALNARDAMQGGGTLRVSARNASDDETTGLSVAPGHEPGAYVALEVADEGRGFDAAAAERAFEPFVSTKPTGEGEGTGLGLAQVHGFCRQAGGAARLESAPGGGTKITLLLPSAVQGQTPGAKPRALIAADALASLRIAVVEDNDALGEATAALLRSYGADVVRLHDASAALEAVEAIEREGSGFDVVLSDVMMPGPIDGVDLARALTSRTPRIPIVLVSGYLRELDPSDGFVVLQKPTGDAQLVTALLAAARTAAT